MRQNITVFVLLLHFLPTLLWAEDTYTRVYSILQTHCTNGCHTAATPGGLLVLDADANTVYNNLVGALPTNPAALNKGYKRVTPGYPDRSFLFKKVNNYLENNFDLDAAEGNAMPPYGGLQLSNVEKELIRQWILFGAPQTGEVVSEAVLEEFYNSGGEFLTPPPAPAAGEGLQIHHGPIFLSPQQEIEAFRKYDLQLPDSLDLIGFSITMNAESHHFVVYQYKPTLTTDIPAGVRVSSGFADEIVMYQNADFLDIWQFGEPHILPENTAFRWGPNTAVDFNYHIKNYSNTSIVPAEAYINFYTQPKNPARKEMQLGLAPYGGTNPFILNIPNTAQDVTFAFAQNDDEDRWIKLWKMQGHTHHLGRDFDVYLRNADGSKGAQLYEGFYDVSYTFNQGYYDYSHPPVLRMDPTMCLNMKDGLIFEAKYFNDGPAPVGFGLTTQEEMFVGYYHYVELSPDEVSECISGIEENTGNKPLVGQWDISPNPSAGKFSITFDILQDIEIEATLSDLLGRKVANVYKGLLPQGRQSLAFEQVLPAGVYLLSVISDKGIETKRVFIGQ